MWPILLLSLTLFGVNQIIISQREPTQPITNDLDIETDPRTGGQNKTTTKRPQAPNRPPVPSHPPSKRSTTRTPPRETNTPEDPYYHYEDPVTNEKIDIPKLLRCNPIDGYKRLPGPLKLGWENEGPEDYKVFSTPLPDYGFLWEGAPESNDLRKRISESKTGDLIRAEFEEILKVLDKSTRVKYRFWSKQTDPDTKEKPKWPVKTSQGAKDVEFQVGVDRRFYLFQLMMQCGPYKLYTKNVHWLEIILDTDECDSGIYAFEDCDNCVDYSKPCPILLD